MSLRGRVVVAGVFLLAAGISLLFPRFSRSQTPLGVFVSGERLQYKVKWLFFRLGTIVVTTEQVPDAVDKYRTSIILDSNPDLFFISIHNRYDAVVHIDPVHCDSLRAAEIDGSDTLVTVYEFVESLGQIRMEQRLYPADSLIRREVKDSIDQFFDGASLFSFARAMLHKDTTLTVPTLVDFDMFQTHITFSTIPVPIEVGVLENSVQTLEVFGRAEFEGKSFGGFSGDFKGWFSADHAAVPLRAEMSIALGTVDVELEEWFRMGWTPPMVREHR